MRAFIDSVLMEGRDPAFGEALWVSPTGGTYAIDEEHPEWLRSAPRQIVGLSDEELWSDDVNWYAIRKGWVRVVVFQEGSDTFLAAKDWNTAKKAFSLLVKQGWSSVSLGAELAVDIYGDDPTQPEESRRIPNPRLFLGG